MKSIDEAEAQARLGDILEEAKRQPIVISTRMASGWVQTARLFADDGQAEPVPNLPGKFRSDSFGLTVAMSGDTIAVGAPAHKHAGHAANSGAVYVFQLVNGAWVQQAELFSPHPNSQDEFGAGQGFGGIGISGDTIVVTDQGKAFSLPGSVDVFTRTNGQWTLSTQLMVPLDPFFFPSSVAIDGNTVAAGSSINDSPTTVEAGAAYVFRFEGGGGRRQSRSRPAMGCRWRSSARA